MCQRSCQQQKAYFCAGEVADLQLMESDCVSHAHAAQRQTHNHTFFFASASARQPWRRIFVSPACRPLCPSGSSREAGGAHLGRLMTLDDRGGRRFAVVIQVKHESSFCRRLFFFKFILFCAQMLVFFCVHIMHRLHFMHERKRWNGKRSFSSPAVTDGALSDCDVAVLRTC